MTHKLNTLSLKGAIICTFALAACATSEMTQPMPVTSDAVVADATTLSKVTVNVTGFKAQQGFVMAALVDAEGYQGGNPLRGDRVAVDSDTVTMTFEGLAAGDYAIRMYHDVNGDGDMNTNAFGMPTEPFAFSNNASGTMGPAPWSKAKFTVSGDTVQNISF